MKIGTIGAGRLAKAFTTHAAKAGFDIIMSNKSGPEALAGQIQAFGPSVRAGTTAEAAQADIVLLSIPWVDVANALRNVPAWHGQIIIDATNALSFTDFKPFDLGDTTSSELVAQQVPGARVVKAFNTLAATTLAANPSEGGGQRVIFFSGDDAAAKAKVLKLIEALGFAGIDLGGLAVGGRLQQFTGVLAAKNLIRLPD